MMNRIITIDAETGEDIELVYIYDAKEILGVSKQRISQIVKDGVLQVYNVYGLPFFKKADVLAYRETRRVGKPARQ